MKIDALRAGPLQANCYIVIDDSENPSGSRTAVVIDPGGDGERIAARVKTLGLDVMYIINTHGHVDHIAGNTALKNATGAKILVCAQDAEMLTDEDLNLSRYAGKNGSSPAADRLLSDGETIDAGNLHLTIIHTPGHTPGGICILCEGHLFSGDTLFLESIGRTDFPGGSLSAIGSSIREKLFRLPPETLVHPGHGEPTTIAHELHANPFFGLASGKV